MGISRLLALMLGVLVVRVLTNPCRLSTWLYEAADVLPAMTHLIDTVRRERSKWGRGPA